MRVVLLALMVVATSVTARQYFNHHSEIRVEPASDDSSNTVHGVWKPQRSPWLNDSPPLERSRRVGRRDFSDLVFVLGASSVRRAHHISTTFGKPVSVITAKPPISPNIWAASNDLDEPIAKASIETNDQRSEEHLASQEKHAESKRIVKHITNLEPSGYNGGNEGNNLEAWQSVSGPNHGGVFPDGYDGLSAMPRTLINEMVSSSGPVEPIHHPIPRPPLRAYPRFPPSPSRRHVPEMRPPGFVPPEMNALSPLSGDFQPDQPLDRSGRDSGDAGETTTESTTTEEVEEEETTTTEENLTTEATTIEEEETTTEEEEVKTSPSTTIEDPQPIEGDPSADNQPGDTLGVEGPSEDSEDLEAGQEIEQVAAVFTMKTPVAPPVFENSVTALFEQEPDDDDLNDPDPVITKKSTSPNGGGAKRSTSYSAPLTVDNQAEESRNTKLNCVPCAPGQEPVPPKETNLPPIEPLPPVSGPYQPPPIKPIGPGESTEPSFVEIHEPDAPSSSSPIASVSSSPSIPSSLPVSPEAPPPQVPITIALPAPNRPIAPSQPSPGYGPVPPTKEPMDKARPPMPNGSTKPQEPAQPEPAGPEPSAPFPVPSVPQTSYGATDNEVPEKTETGSNEQPEPSPESANSSNNLSPAPVPAVTPSPPETSSSPSYGSAPPPAGEIHPEPLPSLPEEPVEPSAPSPPLEPAPTSPGSVSPPSSPSYGPAPQEQGPLPNPDVPVMIALPPPSQPSASPAPYSGTGDEDNGGEVDVSQEQVNPSDRRPELSSISAESSYENISKTKAPTVLTTGRTPSSVDPSHHLSEISHKNLSSVLPSQYLSEIQGDNGWKSKMIMIPPSMPFAKPQSQEGKIEKSSKETIKAPTPLPRIDLTNPQYSTSGPPSIIPPYATIPTKSPVMVSSRGSVTPMKISQGVTKTDTTLKMMSVTVPQRATTSFLPGLNVVSTTPQPPSTSSNQKFFRGTSATLISSKWNTVAPVTERTVTASPSQPSTDTHIEDITVTVPSVDSHPSSSPVTPSYSTRTPSNLSTRPALSSTVTNSLNASPSSSKSPSSTSKTFASTEASPTTKSGYVLTSRASSPLAPSSSQPFSLSTKSPQTGSMDNSGEVISVEEPAGSNVIDRSRPSPPAKNLIPPSPLPFISIESKYGPPAFIPPFATKPPPKKTETSSISTKSATPSESGFMRAIPPSFPNNAHDGSETFPSFGSASQTPTSTDSSPLPDPLPEDYDVDVPLPSTAATGFTPSHVTSTASRQSLIAQISSSGKPAATPDWIMAMYTKASATSGTTKTTPAESPELKKSSPEYQTTSKYTDSHGPVTLPISPPTMILPAGRLLKSLWATSPPSAIPPWAVSSKTHKVSIAPPALTVITGTPTSSTPSSTVSRPLPPVTLATAPASPSPRTPTFPPSHIPPWAVSTASKEFGRSPGSVLSPAPGHITPPLSAHTLPTSPVPLHSIGVLVTAGSQQSSVVPSGIESDYSSENENPKILPEEPTKAPTTGVWTPEMISKYISMQPKNQTSQSSPAPGPVPPVILPSSVAPPSFKKPTSPPSAIPPWALSTETSEKFTDLVPPLALMYGRPDVSSVASSVPPPNSSSVRPMAPVTAFTHFTVEQISFTKPPAAPSENTSYQPSMPSAGVTAAAETSSESPELVDTTLNVGTSSKVPASVGITVTAGTFSPSAPVAVTSPPRVPDVTAPVSNEHVSEEGPYEPLGPQQPAAGSHGEEYVKTFDTVVEKSATETPAPKPQPAPAPAPSPVEHKYGILSPNIAPAPAPQPEEPQPAPQTAPQPVEPITSAPQPSEHSYGAQGPDVVPTAAPNQPPVQTTEAPVSTYAPSNPVPSNPSQGIAVAPQPMSNNNIEEAEHFDSKPSYPGQSSFSNLEEDHEEGQVAEVPAPAPAPSPVPSLPGESNYSNLEEDHEDYHPVQGPQTAPAPSAPAPSQVTGGSSYNNLEEDNDEQSTGTGSSRGSTYSDNTAEIDIGKTGVDHHSEEETDKENNGQSNEDEDYDHHTTEESDDSGESISNTQEQIPEVVVPQKASYGGTIENTAPQPKAYQRPQPIRVQVNPATVPYRPRPSPAPRIQPPRPYNPQPQQPYIQRPALNLPYQPQQPQQPRYPAPIPYQPRPAPFVPFQPIQQRPSPSGCCGGQLFSQQGGLCMPISFNPCQQQNNCGGGCGGGGGSCGGCSGGNSCGGGGGGNCGGGCGSSCGGGSGGGCGSSCGGGCGGCGGGGCSPSCCQPQTSVCCNQMVSTCCQPQQTACCNQQVQSCCPQPVQQSCCCPQSRSICRHKRSLGYAMGICQLRRRA